MRYIHEGKAYQTENLPKWAQALLVHKDQSIRGLTSALEKKIDSETPTRITLDSCHGDIRTLYLDDLSRVRYSVGPLSYRDFIAVRYADYDPNCIELYSGKSLVVKARSSNILQIRSEEA